MFLLLLLFIVSTFVAHQTYKVMEKYVLQLWPNCYLGDGTVDPNFHRTEILSFARVFATRSTANHALKRLRGFDVLKHKYNNFGNAQIIPVTITITPKI